jgi:Plasmid pRiA4b ORF-3-like protein
MNTHILVVDLVQKRRSKVVREIEVRSESNLYDLAKAIVAAYGFDFDHAFGFFSRTGEDYFHSERKYELFADMEELAAEHPDSKNVRRTKVSEVWTSPEDKMLFLFDYGDLWRFTVKLVGFGTAEPKRKYPRILKKTGIPPEQYPAFDEE